MPSVVWIREVVFPVLGMGIVAMVFVGCYRLASRWLNRRHESRLTEQGGGAPSEAVARLAERVDLLEDQAARVQELEERVDFTERLLTRGQKEVS